MADLYSNDKIREHAELMVRQNVHYCVSSLISGLAQSQEACEALGVDWEDEILPICTQDDYVEPALDWIRTASKDDLLEACDHVGIIVETPEESDADALRAMLVEECDGDQDQSREVCDLQRIDPYQNEAYEHWIVDGWFASKLEEHGEMIARDLLGLTVWGRCATGQTISMDSVILQIAKESLEA